MEKQIFDKASGLLLNGIQYGDRVANFTEPLPVSVYFKDGVWNYDYEPFGIFSCGLSKEEALSAFSEDFLVLWDTIGRAADDTLTGDAKQVKRLMNSYMRG